MLLTIGLSWISIAAFPNAASAEEYENNIGISIEAGAELLRAEGVRLQIVSVPSEAIFRQQSKEYQAEVLPQGVTRFGLTAGLPCDLEGLVGEHGTVWGLNSFGFSAPYKVLDEKLGFTAQNVYDQVKKLL